MSKYHSKKVIFGNLSFDSQGEYYRYCELKLLERAGEIGDIKVHPEFPIVINGHRVCKVMLDFSYRVLKPKHPYHTKFEDYKGYDTVISKLKRKLLLACYPDLDLTIVRKVKSFPLPLNVARPLDTRKGIL